MAQLICKCQCLKRLPSMLINYSRREGEEEEENRKPNGNLMPEVPVSSETLFSRSHNTKRNPSSSVDRKWGKIKPVRIVSSFFCLFLFRLENKKSQPTDILIVRRKSSLDPLDCNTVQRYCRGWIRRLFFR